MTNAQSHLYGHIYKEIADLVHDTGSPSRTIEAWTGDRFTLRHVVAVAVNCKAWDGRIDPRNAEAARKITDIGTSGNEYFNGIDGIRPTHLDQLATALFRG